MSYRIEKAKKLQKDITEFQEELRLNLQAIQAVTNAKSGKHIIEELEAKDRKLRKKLSKATKKFYSYADENIKISELSKLNDSEDPFDYEEDYYE